MKEINYIIGDATKPSIKENEYSVICHCCNTLGAWGAGFVIPLGRQYPQAKEKYQIFIETTKPDERLGKVNCVKVNSNIIVANIMGQDKIGKQKDGSIPLSYHALEEGFNYIYDSFTNYNIPFSIHMPRIGCGLAGGDWNTVEKIIKKCFSEKNISVTVYDLA